MVTRRATAWARMGTFDGTAVSEGILLNASHQRRGWCVRFPAGTELRPETLAADRMRQLGGVMEFFLLLWVAMAVVGMLIADGKNRSKLEGALLGGLLGIIGVIIVACLPRGLPQAPLGMRAVTCPRCNAVQNIGFYATSLECWQCHTTTTVWAPPPPAPAPVPTLKGRDPEKTRPVACPSCRARLMIKPTTKKYRCNKCDTVSDAPLL